MLFSTNVQINWHEPFGCLFAEWFLFIVWIQIPNEIPWRVNKCVHGIGFSVRWPTASANTSSVLKSVHRVALQIEKESFCYILLGFIGSTWGLNYSGTMQSVNQLE